jgi:hypothetical protein
MTKKGNSAFAPPGYESDMAAFGDILSDADIWAVLHQEFLPEDIRRHHAAMSKRAKK